MQASPWEGWALVRMGKRIRYMARRLSRGGATIGMDVEDFEQRLGLALVRGVRKWAANQGEAVRPTVGWMTSAVRFEYSHIKRDFVRHGRFFEELDEGDTASAGHYWGYRASEEDEAHERADQVRAAGEVCEWLRAQDPEGFALLMTRHGTEDIDQRLSGRVRSQLYREKSRARDFLEALGIKSMEDVDGRTPKRLPRPPDFTAPG